MWNWLLKTTTTNSKGFDASERQTMKQLCISITLRVLKNEDYVITRHFIYSKDIHWSRYSQKKLGSFHSNSFVFSQHPIADLQSVPIPTSFLWIILSLIVTSNYTENPKLRDNQGLAISVNWELLWSSVKLFCLEELLLNNTFISAISE